MGDGKRGKTMMGFLERVAATTGGGCGGKRLGRALKMRGGGGGERKDIRNKLDHAYKKKKKNEEVAKKRGRSFGYGRLGREGFSLYTWSWGGETKGEQIRGIIC